jgi:transposase
LPVYRPRTRLVNFRLSEDEYQSLKETCAQSGARSVSDYARSAVLSGRLTDGVSEAEPVAVPVLACADRWDRLEGMVQELDQRVRRIAEREGVSNHG